MSLKEDLERASITHRTNGAAATAVRMSTPGFIRACRMMGVETPQERENADKSLQERRPLR